MSGVQDVIYILKKSIQSDLSIIVRETILFNLNPLKFIETCFMAQNMIPLFDYSMCILGFVTSYGE